LVAALVRYRYEYGPFGPVSYKQGEPPISLPPYRLSGTERDASVQREDAWQS